MSATNGGNFTEGNINVTVTLGTGKNPGRQVSHDRPDRAQGKTDTVDVTGFDTSACK